MHRQRWHLLWIWVGVLVAGCGPVWSSNNAPAPTRNPTLPLFGYTLPLLLTPTPWSIYTATPLIPVDAATATASPYAFYLRAGPPACYETPLGSLVCLGQVYNTLEAPLENIVVNVTLLARDGTPLAKQSALLARNILPAGSLGPYRVIFDTVPAGYNSASAAIDAAEVAIDSERRYADLELRQVAVVFNEQQFKVTVSVANHSHESADELVLTVTLLDRSGRVTGFRQVTLEDNYVLAPNQPMSLTISVIPQGSNTVSFDAFVEGRLIPTAPLN